MIEAGGVFACCSYELNSLALTHQYTYLCGRCLTAWKMVRQSRLNACLTVDINVIAYSQWLLSPPNLKSKSGASSSPRFWAYFPPHFQAELPFHFRLCSFPAYSPWLYPPVFRPLSLYSSSLCLSLIHISEPTRPY